MLSLSLAPDIAADTFEGVIIRESRSIITGVYFSQTSVIHFAEDLDALSGCLKRLIAG